MTVKLAYNEFPQQVDGDGAPISGGQLFTYVAGSSTKATTYQDSGAMTANSNPIVFDASGRPPYPIWLTTGVSYKFVFAPADDTDPPQSPIWTLDAITGINDTETEADQWVAGPAPTYVSATSFTLVGDQTSAFQVGRRLKTTNSGGTVYSRIKTSAYTTSTAVTVVNDSGTLDAGLSAVFYGLLTPTDPSTPVALDTYPVVSGSSDRTKLLRIEVDGLTTDTTRVITMPDKDVTLADATTSAGGLIELATDAEVQAYTDTTRAVTAAGLLAAKIQIQSPVTVASGTSVNLTLALPTWVKRVTFLYDALSTNGTSEVMIQGGTSGGFDTANYIGAATHQAGAGITAVQWSTGFVIDGAAAASTVRYGVATLNKGSGDTWYFASGYGASASAITDVAFGRKTFAAALDRLLITTVGGVNSFDGAGTVTLTLE